MKTLPRHTAMIFFTYIRHSNRDPILVQWYYKDCLCICGKRSSSEVSIVPSVFSLQHYKSAPVCPKAIGMLISHSLVRAQLLWLSFSSMKCGKWRIKMKRESLEEQSDAGSKLG